jgi:hypothetical protein
VYTLHVTVAHYTGGLFHHDVPAEVVVAIHGSWGAGLPNQGGTLTSLLQLPHRGGPFRDPGYAHATRRLAPEELSRLWELLTLAGLPGTTPKVGGFPDTSDVASTTYVSGWMSDERAQVSGAFTATIHQLSSGYRASEAFYQLMEALVNLVPLPPDSFAAHEWARR